MARWLLALALWVLPLEGKAQEEVEVPSTSEESSRRKQKRGRKKKKRKTASSASASATVPIERPGFDMEVRGRLEVGAFQGWKSREGTGALLSAEVVATSEARYERFRLRVPLRLRHRQTFGLAVTETLGSGGAELQWRLGPRLRLSAEGTLAGAWRPGWPDLYQPLGSGQYVPSARRSHLDRKVEVQLAGIPLRHHHARLKYRYVLSDYLEDPNFDAFERPMHLTPRDNERHELTLRWRYFLKKGYDLTAQVEAFERHDFFLFARDAGTGKTHAVPGGRPPNPLQAFRGVEPSVGGEMSLFQHKLTVEARYGYVVVADLFQGYYSHTGHHPALRVEYAPWEGISLWGGAEAWLREYGEGSYAEGPGHPPLLFGTRRVDRRGVLDAGLRVALWPGVAARLEGRFVSRQTNFPPYVPGVFPSQAAYDFKWNYDNWMVLAGVEYHR